MKVNKTQALLYMYKLLMEKGYFTKDEILSEINMNNLTFLRYIQELRAFFINFVPDAELIFSKSSNKYRIILSKEL